MQLLYPLPRQSFCATNHPLSPPFPPSHPYPPHQHLLLQALQDELEEAAKGGEGKGGQEGGHEEEEEEKFWAKVAAEEKRCVSSGTSKSDLSVT